ncbi:glycosyltransferase [Romeria aff. gracilis LEGE 07310]|uniref:Glycosyltransferase n=1 Tax=Vasconcelosia minhoensis LEGE 07310 TaxID=915328 RepID=A0A8J7AKU4_9CYAN|nr:glycosyltransferase [Romeria gracilis]MBE9079588.1 glycosyltransferase [Romeria aff. gracilis LEGE 07310]
MNVAVVHEWLASYAGSEKVVEQILRQYPQADLYSLVDFLPDELRYFIQHRPVRTSFLQRLPLARQRFRSYLPLMPIAVEQFDLAEYDLVISSHHAVAKGVITRPDQLHISYVHTPMRYAWEFQLAYLRQSGLNRGLKSAATRLTLHYLRLWDIASANRADGLIANSQYVARRIWKTYRRPAEVIYPPVAIERFRADLPRDRFYLTVSRFVPYKRVDLTIEAFNQLGLPLVVIGDGPGWSAVKALAGSQVQLLGSQPDTVVEDLMQRCRAFIFPAEEDFGITPVEAQAAGAPVIVYQKGGQAETVIPGKTGLLFSTQTAESLVQSVKQIESGQVQFDAAQLRHQAELFSVERFQTQFRTYINRAWARFQAGDPLE